MAIMIRVSQVRVLPPLPVLFRLLPALGVSASAASPEVGMHLPIGLRAARD